MENVTERDLHRRTLNFFMPTQKLKSKTRVGSKEIKVYDEPQSPFQRLLEHSALPQELKDALVAQRALYNPVELQQNVNKAIPRLRQRLAQINRIQTQEWYGKESSPTRKQHTPKNSHNVKREQGQAGRYWILM
jgi:hypothetical protein